jgi:glycine/D-amino acid oxidase-like deaminating enzyme
MPLGGEVDVVVVGFGVSGARAAAAAAAAGARVVVLDRRGVLASGRRPGSSSTDSSSTGSASTGSATFAQLVRRRLWSIVRQAFSPRLAARTAALAAGVEVRMQTVVHELLVEDGRVLGVGCTTMDPRTPSGARYWWLDRLAGWAPRLSPTLGGAVIRAAESLWHESSSVEEIRCSAVVLGVDRSNWDFVGPAVWAATALAGRARPGAPPARRSLSVVSAGLTTAPSPTPELAARAWCAAQEQSPTTPDGLTELHVDPASGAVGAGAGRVVPGLYAAVSDPGGPPDADACVTAGVAAATSAHRAAGRHLRCVV